MRLILFGTSGCHLCEQAEGIINECLADGLKKVIVDTVDIAEDGRYYDLYAIRIPVLYHPATKQELAWPFDQASVDEFILLTDKPESIRKRST